MIKTKLINGNFEDSRESIVVSMFHPTLKLSHLQKSNDYRLMTND